MRDLGPEIAARKSKSVGTVIKLAGIALQGVLSPADATRAADAGVDGVIVSNHGGRQVDYAPAAVDMLPPIAEVLRGRGIPVLVDGGIRRGTDIIKAGSPARLMFVGPLKAEITSYSSGSSSAHYT